MYYYELYENGKIIAKHDLAVDAVGPDDYFDSPFVKRWWYVEDTSEQEKVDHDQS